MRRSYIQNLFTLGRKTVLATIRARRNITLALSIHPNTISLILVYLAVMGQTRAILVKIRFGEATRLYQNFKDPTLLKILSPPTYTTLAI
jgi:hypothetical protein